MTAEEHAQKIAKLFSDLMLPKYLKGAEEHGGHLWEFSKTKLLDNAIDEAIDQVVYLFTLRDQLKQTIPSSANCYCPSCGLSHIVNIAEEPLDA